MKYIKLGWIYTSYFCDELAPPKNWRAASKSFVYIELKDYLIYGYIVTLS